MLISSYFFKLLIKESKFEPIQSITMEHSSLIQLLKTRLPNWSTNDEIRQKMAPFDLGSRMEEARKTSDYRLGGVLILLFEKNGEPHLALIQRPEYDGVHSGQIAFPGGKMEDGDNDLEYTALRETWEEIGTFPELTTIIGKLSDVFIPPSRFMVSPFVGFYSGEPTFIKDDFEVEKVLEMPISLLLDDQIVQRGKVKVGVENYTLVVPFFDVFGHKVWGATAIMLSELKAIIQ